MKRRDVLKSAGLFLGYAMTAGTAAAVLGGCSADPTPNWTPSFISEDEAKMIRVLADAIIPGTDTKPGAKDVMIDKFMDERLVQYGKEEDKTKFQEGMAAFISANPNFSAASTEDKLAIIAADLKADSKFMKGMHEQSIVGFCTSERGVKEVLVFDPIPGGYQEVVPVEEVGGIHAY